MLLVQAQCPVSEAKYLMCRISTISGSGSGPAPAVGLLLSAANDPSVFIITDRKGSYYLNVKLLLGAFNQEKALRPQ